jgi:hypothetical protein
MTAPMTLLDELLQDRLGAPRRIPHSEYTRRGYDLPTDDDFITITS